MKLGRKEKHGGSGTKLHGVWKSMKDRCYNLKSKVYKYYGGRGITVCPEWADKYNGFVNFRDWSLSNGYQEGLTIDRINNNVNYNPNNCQWITQKENNRKKSQVILTQEKANEIRELHNTGGYSQKELAKKFNVSCKTISSIIKNRKWKE